MSELNLPRDARSRRRVRAASRDRRGLRGQALVETALMLPVILILLLGAIDFGRLFFSWVSLHQAARIAANYASVDPTTTSADIPDVIADETGVMNCDPGVPVLVYTSSGTPTTIPELGDYAEVTLSCDFSLLTPLAGFFFGDPIPMRAAAAFPVRTGCLGCGSGPGGEPPPPPPNQCRAIPDLEGMSVAGARLAWASAGFVGAFIPDTGRETETVAPDPVVAPLDSSCPSGYAIFNASVTIDTIPPEGSPPGPIGCQVVPNLIGLTISDARDLWDDSAFSAVTFLPPPPDDDSDAAVANQTSAPVTVPGVSCVDPASLTQIEVEVGASWPPPPDAPCQVPHLIDKRRPDGAIEWGLSGFTGAYRPSNGNFIIKSQSLVGFSWLPCDAEITVSP